MVEKIEDSRLQWWIDSDPFVRLFLPRNEIASVTGYSMSLISLAHKQRRNREGGMKFRFLSTEKGAMVVFSPLRDIIRYSNPYQEYILKGSNPVSIHKRTWPEPVEWLTPDVVDMWYEEAYETAHKHWRNAYPHMGKFKAQSVDMESKVTSLLYRYILLPNKLQNIFEAKGLSMKPSVFKGILANPNYATTFGHLRVVTLAQLPLWFEAALLPQKRKNARVKGLDYTRARYIKDPDSKLFEAALWLEGNGVPPHIVTTKAHGSNKVETSSGERVGMPRIGNLYDFVQALDSNGYWNSDDDKERDIKSWEKEWAYNA